MILGQRIREEREKRSWSQNDLAEKLKVSRQSISKWENGSAYPDLERLLQLSEIFKVSLDSLILGNKKNKQVKNHVGMTFWDFLSERWWIVFVIAWCLAWLLPIIIHALKG